MNKGDRSFQNARRARAEEYREWVRRNADELGATPEMEDRYGPTVGVRLCVNCGYVLDLGEDDCPYCAEEEDRKDERMEQESLRRGEA